jgi:hypothetical protein
MISPRFDVIAMLMYGLLVNGLVGVRRSLTLNKLRPRQAVFRHVAWRTNSALPAHSNGSRAGMTLAAKEDLDSDWTQEQLRAAQPVGESARAFFAPSSERFRATKY